MKTKKGIPRIGKLPPRYSLILNQYKDFRASKCVQCEKPTFLRKFALFIHVDDVDPFIMGKTCRYCAKCELIVVHKDELDNELYQFLIDVKSEAIGNDYFILGTVDKKVWKKGLEMGNSIKETFDHLADIKNYLDLEIEPAGWYFEGER